MNIKALNEVKAILAYNKSLVLNASNPQAESKKNLQSAGYIDENANVTVEFKNGLVHKEIKVPILNKRKWKAKKRIKVASAT